jgi:two-component system sensor histidine kinase BarA
MKSWSIRKQIIVLALLPALFVGLGLTTYFTYTQIEYISSTLRKHGESISTQIAPAAEYAVFSGNMKFLEPTLKNALNDQDVVAITIKDRDNQALISLHKDNPGTNSQSIWRKLIKTQIVHFEVPIITQEVAIDDLNENSSQNTDEKIPESDVIGYVSLDITTYFSDGQKILSLNRAAMLTVIILVAGFVLAVRVSRQIAIPVMLLTDTVRKIASGDFRTRVTHDAPGELGVLESYVNSMADELQSYQEDMESRINDFTHELQQTLEELELRNAELDITRSNALAASRAKSEFLANMSHEIRTPLCGIMGFSELIDNTRLDEQQKDYITTIRKSAGNLLNIIDDILDLSKIESGKLEISPVEFNLLDIIEEVIDLLSPAAYEKNIELIYNLHKDTPRQIEADPVRIRQVLINLIGNALKFTEKGYVYLEIRNAPLSNRNEIRFSVTDTGIGMSLSGKQTLFHAFTQADTSITRRFGGTGLGLVISRKLTLLMNGSIDFDSVENKGSHFWFQIPVIIKNEKTEFVSQLAGVRIALSTYADLCYSAASSMLEYWGCKIISPEIAATTPEDCADLSFTCYNLEDLSRIRAGEIIPDRTIPDKPHLAVISSNRPEDVELVRTTCVDKVIFFASSQTQIYDTLCKLVSKSYSPDRSAVATVPYAPSNWSGVHVLIVDDNGINRRLAEIILHQHNAQVVTASSGESAIKLVEKHAFDIIFMDLHMPGLDGYAATKRIRQLQTIPDPVIIALTANAMPAERVRIYESGMNDIMIKPISEQIMNAVILRWLNNSGDTKSDIDSEIFSIEEAEKFTAGNAILAIELTNMLKIELPEYQQKIALALETQNYAELKVQVHKLHGASRCCGTPALREAAEYLERVIDSEQYDELTTATIRLRREITRLLDYPIKPL